MALQQKIGQTLNGDLMRALAISITQSHLNKALLRLLRLLNLNASVPAMKVR